MMQDDEVCSAGIALLFVSLAVRHCGQFAINVKGWSMGSTLGPSATVNVRPLERSPRCGDIVLVVIGGNLVIHRVVSYGSSHVVTKGDRCRRTDGSVAMNDVLGLVASINRSGSPLVPWHWRWPFAPLIALLSRLEAADVSSRRLGNVVHKAWYYLSRLLRL